MRNPVSTAAQSHTKGFPDRDRVEGRLLMGGLIEEHRQRLKQASEVFGDILSGAFEGPARRGEKNPRAGFISRHAWNIQERGKDVLAALAAARTGCIPILNRPGLESLFNLGAAAADPKFAYAKQVYEMQEASRLTQLMGESGDSQLDDELERQLRSHELAVRAYGAVAGNEKFATFKIADKAGMVSLYRTEYFACSQMTHANTGDLGRERSPEQVAEDVRVTVLVHRKAGTLVNDLYCKDDAFRVRLARLAE